MFEHPKRPQAPKTHLLVLEYEKSGNQVQNLDLFGNVKICKTILMEILCRMEHTNPVWNKIYVDISPLVNGQGNADHFEVYVECVLEAGRSTGTVGLDNLRILTY